ncbi:phage baseplate protein [Alkalinema pantanalense CENA528]|uniref:T4 family baseplate hub assembly chaperone n=1 Tax=Alkalinema pantanalense TaxID=1620705 RepID=UPI003D6F7940
MRALSAQDILQIWEIGQFQHPLDRAMTLLAFALPEKTGEDLTQLTIGQRDAYLLQLRQSLLGSQLESFATCPHCGEALEFSLQVPDLQLAEPEAISSVTQSVTLDGFEIQFSLPTSRDLAAVVGCREVAIAAQQLTQRCLHRITQSGQTIEAQQLPPSVLMRLSQHMTTVDPQAELLLDLVCPNCGHTWQVLFDIVSFFWTELTVQAKRLLREVHLLARAYGWREGDILTMSATRRQFYLELVT